MTRDDRRADVTPDHRIIAAYEAGRRRRDYLIIAVCLGGALIGGLLKAWLG